MSSPIIAKIVTMSGVDFAQIRVFQGELSVLGKIFLQTNHYLIICFKLRFHALQHFGTRFGR